MNNLCDYGLPQLGAKFLDTVGEKPKPPKFAPATKCHRAIDLSCVRCDGDGRWAWIPGGGLRSAPLPPPTSDTLIPNLGMDLLSRKFTFEE